MIWAQKHFAYAHNIRYVMLCYVNMHSSAIGQPPHGVAKYAYDI